LKCSALRRKEIDSIINLNNKFKNSNNNSDNPPFPAKKHIFVNPHNIRFSGGPLSKVAICSKGVYIFVTPNGYTYVGSSINLFVRVNSYFYYSILKSGTRAVLVHFLKNGFDGVVLKLYIMDPNSSIDQVLKMEQYFLDKYFNQPLNLNKDNIASGSGKHYPMSEKAKQRLRIQRGISFYVYDVTTASIVYFFESKTFAQLHMNIDHRTLNDCLNNGSLYLGQFILSLEIITEMQSYSESILSLIKFKKLINFSLAQ